MAQAILGNNLNICIVQTLFVILLMGEEGVLSVVGRKSSIKSFTDGVADGIKSFTDGVADDVLVRFHASKRIRSFTNLSQMV